MTSVAGSISSIEPDTQVTNPLKRLFDVEKSAYHEWFTACTIKNFLDFLRIFLADADDEGKMFHHFDQESSKVGNRNLDNDFALDSKPNRISEESFQFHLEDEKAAHLPLNFVKNSKHLETMTTKENEKSNRLVNVSSQTSVNTSGKFGYGLMYLPLKPKPKSKQDSENNSAIKMPDCISSNEDSSTGEIPNKGKRNKIKSYK